MEYSGIIIYSPGNLEPFEFSPREYRRLKLRKKVNIEAFFRVMCFSHQYGTVTCAWWVCKHCFSGQSLAPPLACREPESKFIFVWN